jgi:hypothetical protein
MKNAPNKVAQMPTNTCNHVLPRSLKDSRKPPPQLLGDNAWLNQKFSPGIGLSEANNHEWETWSKLQKSATIHTSEPFRAGLPIS